MIRHEHVAHTSEHLEVTNLGFKVPEFLEWRDIPHLLLWKPVDDVCGSLHALGPKSCWHIFGMQHAPTNFRNMSVLPLGYSILLWGVGAGQLPSDLVLLQVGIEFSG